MNRFPLSREERLDAAAKLPSVFEYVCADESLLVKAIEANPWFSEAFIRQAASAMKPWFEPGTLHRFLSAYPENPNPKRVAILMAANVPFVGFQDLLFVFLSGNFSGMKFSARDSVMMQALVDTWKKSASLPEEVFVPFSSVSECDFFLATGSDNTARHTAWMFREKPGIIRRNRYSAGILQGDENAADWEGLAKDILLYHGMGCRSISNLFVPYGMNLHPLREALAAFPAEHLSPLWKAHIEWETALVKMKEEADLIPGKMLIREAPAPSAVPPGWLNVIRFENEEELKSILQNQAASLQCIAGKDRQVAFGKTQFPALEDFPDGVDVIRAIQESNAVSS